MNEQEVAQELVRLARELVSKKGEVPEAFKKQWKDKDKDNDGKENEPKPDFLKKKKSSRVRSAKGDPWGERNKAAQKLEQLATDVQEDIWISEDKYHFDDPQYARKVDAKIAKISKIVDDTVRKVESVLSAF